MSQTDTYGEQLISGLLAGAKFKALQEDLKFSRLQRLEWEANKQHRTQMDALAEQLGVAQLQRENAGAQLEELQRQQAEFALASAKEDRPAEVATKRAGVRQARAQAKGAEQSNRFAAREQPLREALLKSQTAATDANTAYQNQEAGFSRELQPARLATAQAGAQSGAATALGTLGGVARNLAEPLASLGTQINPSDVVAALKAGGADDKALPLLTQVFMGQIQAQQNEITQHKTYLDREQAKAQADAERDKSAAFGQAVASGLNLANVASQNPGAVDEYAKLVKPEDFYSQVALAIGRSGVPKALPPGEVALQKGLAEQISSQLATRDSLVGQAAAIRSGSQGSGSLWTSSATAAKRLDEQVKAIDKNIESLKAQLNGLTKSSSKAQTSSTPSDDNIPIVTSQAEHGKLPKGAQYRTQPGGPVYTKQ